jgi:ABC-type multidrug transport system ATPase subunit
LDEPTSNLDAKGRRCLVDLLRARTETLIVATHDLDVARALCSRGVVLDSGSVAYDGPLERLLGDFGTLERHGLAVSLE